jgi:carbonic anhydrase
MTRREADEPMIDFADDAQDLIAGYRRFRHGRYREAAGLFRQLRDGQQPATMIIACADSRADPSMIFDAAPGELFVVRNVAALVPPFDDDATHGLHGVSAALEFAVTALKVKQILVMGHGGCGGIAACLAAAADRPVGHFIAPWVELAAPARDAVLADASIARADWQEAVEHGAVGQSLDNLRTFPFVREAMEKGALNLNGAWFSIGRGALQWRDPETGKFSIVDSGPAPLDKGEGI